MTKIFKIPFATQGDRTAVPDEVQADGSLSYTQGYGYDYERDQATDPAAKDIEREKMNSLFHDITGAVGEMQAFGMPVWAEEGKPYAIRSVVYHNKKAWQSKIENNNTEPAAGAAWMELKADMTAGEVGAYTKGESDQKFQPLGNYLPAGYSYSKAESDTNFQPKGNYAPAGNYAVKGESYTKAEGDQRYQAKGNYAPAGDYAVKGESYTKSESDNKYQPKGSYQTAGYSYSKAESDSNFQPKGNYAPAGNYALKGDSYTKSESDNKYQPKGSYQAAGYSYSKAESDNKYQTKGLVVNKNTANRSVNGWWKCGDTGIIMNWLTAPANSGQRINTATFPAPFPNQCLNVTISWVKTEGQMDYPCRVVSFDKNTVKYIADGYDKVSITAIGF